MGEVIGWTRLWAGGVLLFLTSAAPGAVSLTLLDSSGNSKGVDYGGTSFSLNVAVLESSSSDAVTGIDYQVASFYSNGTTPVSNVFTFVSRTSYVASGNSSPAFFDQQYTSDSGLSSTPLNPSNGTNLGGYNSAGGTLMSVGSTPVASIAFKVAANAPVGTYQLKFYLPVVSSSAMYDTDYSGPGPNYTTTQFSSVGTYSVFVPEPASFTLIVSGSSLGLLRRRRR